MTLFKSQWLKEWEMFDEWRRSNPWYRDNATMRRYADDKAHLLLSCDLPYEKKLRVVTVLVEDQFPVEFTEYKARPPLKPCCHCCWRMP